MTSDFSKTWRQRVKLAKIGQKRPKTAKIDVLRAKKWLYIIDTFFWHILAKFKKNPQNGCFAKSQKPPNDVKFASDVNIFGQNWPKTAKIWFLRVKIWFYVIGIIFCHILAKFKKNPRNGFFSKSQNTRNDVKTGQVQNWTCP